MDSEELLSAAAGMLRLALGAGVELDVVRAALLDGAATRDVAAGTVVVAQGTSGREVYLLMRGRLRADRRECGVDTFLGEVRPAELFGEISALTGQARMATITAIESSSLVVLEPEVVDRLLARESARSTVEGLSDARRRWAEARRFRPRPDEIFAALEPFTGVLDEAVRAELEGELHWITAHRGTDVIREGEVGDSLYFVLGGRLDVLVGATGGDAKSVAEIGTGETVGESALLTNEPRGATVRVLADAELLRLSRIGFERLVARHPLAMATFARTVASRLQRSVRMREPVARLRVEALASAEDCRKIAATPNLVLRNLKITQMYHRLSLDIARLVGQRDANWCTFATTASKTAGYSIRREELPLIDVWHLAMEVPQLRPLLRGLGRSAAAAAEVIGLSARIDAVLQGVSDAISDGNLAVFAELGPIFADFVQTFHDATEYDRAELVRFLNAHLRPGTTESGGQDTLREALTHYYDAMFERSEKARAELMLLGNLKIGLHEQKRLQPEIARGLNVPSQLGLRGLLAFPGGEGLEARLSESLRLPMRKALTVMMMRLRTPRGSIWLGRDVPVAQRKQMFPDVLRSLTNPELVALLAKVDTDPDSVAGSYATDWASLEQRMNFIADLFRTRQRSLDLFESPFEYDQRIEMASERVPLGAL